MIRRAFGFSLAAAAILVAVLGSARPPRAEPTDIARASLVFAKRA
jgi:hypothetical protein